MSVKDGRGPFPNPTVRAFTAINIQAHCTAVYDVSM
jgi:hypothetical protein